MRVRPDGSLCLIQLLVISVALLSSLASQNYSSRIITEANGLPHSSILGIAQTSDGLLWFSTFSGLATYDSREFAAVNIDVGLQEHEARYHITTNERGDLWAFRNSPPYKGQRRVDGEWLPVPKSELPDSSFARAALVEVAVAQSDGEDFALLGNMKGQLFHVGPKGWHPVALASGRIYSICVQGDQFVIAHDRGVHTLPVASPEVGVTAIMGLPTSEVLAVAHDRSRDSVWMVARTWIAERRADQLIVHVPEMRDAFYESIVSIGVLPDEQGGIYIGERAGCMHFHPDEGLDYFDRSNSLDDIGVTRMMRDREGIIWASGMRGVAKFAGRSLVNRTSKQGLGADEVTAILELRDGRMVLGHNASITLLGDKAQVIDLAQSASYSRIMSMVQAPDGAIIAAANRAGLLRIDPDSLATDWLPSPPLSVDVQSPEMHVVQGVTINERGQILVAGWKRAWWQRSDGAELIDLSPTQSRSSYVRQIVFDGDRLLLALRNGGVSLLAGDTHQSWTSPLRAFCNATCVKRLADGRIWAGTAGGAVQAHDDGVLRLIDFGGDQIKRPVYSMTNDLQGRIWFGTNDGVAVWDGQHLRRISSREGLAGRETNRGANVCDSKGRMWFGFDRGVTTYYPKREVAPRFGPTVALLTPRINGVVARGDDWQRLTDHQSIAFRLRSISMRDEEQLLHEYRLEGLDDNWTKRKPLAEPEIVYQSLAVGSYRLHVRATDSAGQSSVATSPWIEVMPPWWRSWWFALLAAITVILLVVSVATYASQWRHTHLLQHMVSAQTADLRTERNRLSAMLSSIADGVIGTDKDGVVIVWNPTATRLTGWPIAHAVGQRLNELMPGLQSQDATTVEQPVPVKVADGSTRWFEFTAAEVTDEPDSGRVIAFRDVTDRRQQERLLTRTERLESLGILAGGIAHDFNNLLTVMLGNLSLLEIDDQSGQQPQDNAEQLRDEIREAVLRARDLTQQLLTFSKGGEPVRKLGSLRKAVTESTQLALSGANVRSDIQIDDNLYPVAFDFGQLSQVIHNLVLNARQAMPAGGTVVVRGHNVECSPKGAPAKYALIEVRDEGVGIAPEDLEHIFDPYFSTKPQGTGLGLATSHSIIQRHDGFLTVESRPGSGTVIRIHLPASSAAIEGTASPAIAAESKQSVSLGVRHILCMDDEAAIRSLLAASLQRLGHRTVVVADGKAAVVAYREAQENGDPFDFVLLDLTVPGGMGGIDTLAKLQSLDPAVVAIATTGYSIEPVRAKFHELGFRALLSKPFGMCAIQAALTQAAGGVDDEPTSGGSF
jgi:PAS domain S-box-containing protein